ncbi:MAG: threonine--tRNA ligase [Deltaproteobacteria bacterium]|nr:threonine--tRNA ligase [Deltaproteobacteria bacterium]
MDSIPDSSAKLTTYKIEILGEWLQLDLVKDQIPTAADLLTVAEPLCRGEKRPLAVKIDDKIVSSNTELYPEMNLSLVTANDPAALELLRHSMAHVMAEAVVKLFPQAKVAIGPAIEDGFYYDFDNPEPFTLLDLEKISAEMEKIVKENQKFIRTELPSQEALQYFQERGEVYKVELISDLIKTGVETVSLYQCGTFTDLCRGPHIPDTSWGKAFKLLSVAGAYWRGDERRPMLQRIYGTAFFKEKDLRAYLAFLEEAKSRDHRRLGKELELFSTHDEIGGGLVVWHPKGALLRTLLEDFEKQEHLRRGYDIVIGPQILKSELWAKSGHLSYYKENMYFTEIDGIGYGIKPMNCVGHMFIYRSKIRSFRDLPLRFFELGTVQRHEKSGVLHGLTRVRQFTQDDAHIFCTPSQLNQEIVDILNFVKDMMAVFGFDFELELSTRPSKSIGTDEEWELATQALTNALEEIKRPYEINHGDGAFYGPKIDVKLKDALNRSWQCATIQCDFTLPERFDLSYTDSNNQKKRPVMLHRTVFGSMERFIGVLIEHFKGAFPRWLSPVQGIILTVTSRADEASLQLARELKKHNFRVATDLRNEKLGYKIREAWKMKIPYALVLGDNEAAKGTLSVRHMNGQTLGEMTLNSFLELISKEKDPPVLA